MAVVLAVEVFKSEYIRLYKSEVNFNYSKPVLMGLIDYHISLQCHTDSLLVDWSPTGVGEGSTNLA